MKLKCSFLIWGQIDNDEQGGLQFEIAKERISIRQTAPTPRSARTQPVSSQRNTANASTHNKEHNHGKVLSKIQVVLSNREFTDIVSRAAYCCSIGNATISIHPIPIVLYPVIVANLVLRSNAVQNKFGATVSTI